MWSRRRSTTSPRAREITREHGALLWLDEIQTGVGRTGAWYAHQNPAVADPMDGVADIVTVAKGLAGGFPIGACIATGDAADLLQPGNHGTTFGGNPVARGRGLAVLDTIEKDGLLEHATERRPAPARRPARRRPGHRGPRLRPADRARPDRARVRRGVRGRPRRRLHRQQPDPRTRPAGAPADPHRRAGRLVPRAPGRGSSTRRTGSTATSRDPPLPARRRPVPEQQAAVLELAARAQGQRRTTHDRWPDLARSRCSSTSRPCAPRRPSPRGSPSSVASR